MCMCVSMYNFASLATKSVAWAPSQHYNIVVVPSAQFGSKHTYAYHCKYVRTYVRMRYICAQMHIRARACTYICMYACTCILTTPHKSQTKENHHTKKNARGEHRKQGK